MTDDSLLDYNLSESNVEKAPLSLGSSIVKGVFWNTGEVLLRDGFQLIVKIILARLLIPEYFGLVGMAIVFTKLIDVTADLGFSDALIQKRENELQAIHWNSIFWGTICVALLLYLIIVFIIGPFASWFYTEPKISSLMVFLGIPVLLKPIIVINRAILIKNLNFKPIAIIDSVSVVIGGICAITLALSGAGVWSIVLQGPIIAFVSVPLFMLTVKWFPKIEFSKKAFLELFWFGKYLTANRIFSYITGNIDYLLVGKLLGSEQLGIYTIAFLITDILRSRIKSVFDKVFFPVISKVQEDLKKVKKYYLMTVRFISIIVFPFITLLALYAEYIVTFVFGDKWIAAVFPIQMISIAVLIHSLGGSSAPVFQGIGKPDLTFKLSVIKTVFFGVPSIIVGALYWGINGVAAAVIAYKTATRFMFQFNLKKYINVSEKEILLSLMPSLVGSLSILVIYFMTFNMELNILGLSSVLISSLMLYGIIILFMTKEELLSLKNMFVIAVRGKETYKYD